MGIFFTMWGSGLEQRCKSPLMNDDMEMEVVTEARTVYRV